MNVDEFLSDLYNDELSDMFIGNRNSKEEPRAKLLPMMNKAMLQAYAKYNIKLDVYSLTVTTDEHTYTLEALDLLAVIGVVNVHNRVLEPHEVRILGDVLYFPCPEAVELTVMYKVKPERFTEAQVDEDIKIELPELLLPWMSSWVAARTFLSRKDDTSIGKGTELMQLANTFEETYQATNTTNEFTKPDHTKLYARGFC